MIRSQVSDLLTVLSPWKLIIITNHIHLRSLSLQLRLDPWEVAPHFVLFRPWFYFCPQAEHTVHLDERKRKEVVHSKNLKWTRILIWSSVRIYVICLSSEMEWPMTYGRDHQIWPRYGPGRPTYMSYFLSVRQTVRLWECWQIDTHTGPILWPQLLKREVTITKNDFSTTVLWVVRSGTIH